MARKYDYNFTPRQNREIRNAVARFNRTVDRLNRMYGSDSVALPGKRTVSDIKSRILDRNDLMRELRSLNAIKRGRAADIVTTELGVRTVRYLVRDAAQRARVIQRREAAREAEFLPTVEIPDGRGGTVSVPDIHEGRPPRLPSSINQGKNVAEVEDIYGALEEGSSASYEETEGRLAFERYMTVVSRFLDTDTQRELRAVVDGDYAGFGELELAGELPSIEEWYEARKNEERLETLMYQFNAAFSARG